MSFAKYQDPYSENPYGQDAGYQPNPSTEKVFDDVSNTQRALPGRSGLRNQTKSWAEVGPPPRSTGILRMWRKDERGHQWTRVGHDCNLADHRVVASDLLRACAAAV